MYTQGLESLLLTNFIATLNRLAIDSQVCFSIDTVLIRIHLNDKYTDWLLHFNKYDHPIAISFVEMKVRPQSCNIQ